MYSASKCNEKNSDKGNLKISSSILYRLTSDKSAAKGEVLSADSENEWIDKLVDMDKIHTKKNGLTIEEAERMLNNLNAYVSSKPQRSCPVDTFKVTECLKENKGNALICGRDVESFKRCVDKSLHEAVSKNAKEVAKKKKETYAETFERKYQI